MTKKRALILFFILLLLIIAVVFIVPVHYQYYPPRNNSGTFFIKLNDGNKLACVKLEGRAAVKKCVPVIFLQGGPGGPVYTRNIEALRPLADSGFDVYLYDQLGCGFSSRLKNIRGYTVQRHVDDLQELIQFTGSPQVFLIGQSWGALLASAYAGQHSSDIKGIVLTSPGPLMPANNQLALLPAPDSLGLRSPQFTNRQGKDKTYTVRARVVEFFARTFGIKLASDNEMDAFANQLNFEMSRSTLCDQRNLQEAEGGSGYYSMIRTARDFAICRNMRTGLDQVDVPVLILRGACDGIPWGFVTEYQKYYKNSRLLIAENAGHAIATEQPRFYISAIYSFLQSCNAR